jgi:hypothetical protein
MLQRVFVADLDLARLAAARAKVRGSAEGGNGAAAESGPRPGDLAGDRAALDGQPDGTGP